MTTTSRTNKRWNPLGLALFALGFLQWHVDAGSPVDPNEKEINMNFASEEGDEVSPFMNISAEAAGTQGVSDVYSIIVLSDNKHRSNAFRDHARMHTYSEEQVSVQIGDPDPVNPLGPDSPPFYVRHPPGASKRVRIFHTGNRHSPDAAALTHLKAACEDPSELTLVLYTDEFCVERPLTEWLPPACWPHIARHYPFNPASSDRELRHAYIPLGPRNTFKFVLASERVPASKRGTFYGVAVREDTAPRRAKLVNIASEFRTKHPSIAAFVNERTLTSDDYRSLLLDSVFTVCPGGHNPETFRMFETLEAGSIPIVSRQDFLYPSYRAPFPCGEGDASWNTVAASPFAQAVSVGSWDELPDLLERLKSSPAEYIDRLQAESVAWYEALMRRMYQSMLNFGQGYDLWPQYGPIILEGFPAPTEPYPDTPPYEPEEV